MTVFKKNLHMVLLNHVLLALIETGKRKGFQLIPSYKSHNT